MSLLNNDFLPKLTFNGDSKMSVINSNSAAMITANSLNKNDREMNGIMERLSTGKRINSAADDAAGLAIATKMTAQIRGLDQAGRNANNATSMLQLADGAAEQVSDILQRMREITVQAADGSNSSADVDIINVEFIEAAKEIDRIVNSTQFNGKNLLDGSAGGSTGDSTVNFQVGANATQILTVDFADFNLAAGGGSGSAALVVHSVTDAQVTGFTGGLTVSDGSREVAFTEAEVKATATTEGLALLIEQQGLNLIVSATANTSLTLTSNNIGTQASPSLLDGASTPAALATANGTSVITAGTAGGPLAGNLGGYATTGMGSTAGFTDTLRALDLAITGVATQRATFGASMNRLTSVVDNLASASEATSTARGRIEDANYASETTALARSQIISQAGTAMLAQANQKAQSVLSLLQ